LRLNLDDIEVLFSLIDMGSLAEPRSKEARGNADSMKHVIADTVTVNRHKLGRLDVEIDTEKIEGLMVKGSGIERFWAQHPAGPGIPLFQLNQYSLFAGLLAGSFESRGRDMEDCVITFNYDTVLEESIWGLGGAVDYGISRVRMEGRQNAGNPKFVTPVFKLHGSANWAKPSDPSDHKVRASIFDSYRDFGESLVPLVVPPTWKKGDLAPMFAEIWRGARNALAKATRICIVGYSMRATDPFFHHLMASALGENEGLYRLDVVDTLEGNAGVESLVNRYRDVFEPLDGYGRLHFHTDGLAGFLSTQWRFSGALGRGAAIRAVTRY